MVMRLRPGIERKTPNMCISVIPDIFMQYGVFCRDEKNSSASRELTLFIKKVVKENKINKKYIKNKYFMKKGEDSYFKKTSKINISIERSISEKFKKIVSEIKEKPKITTILTNRIIEQLKTVKDKNKNTAMLLNKIMEQKAIKKGREINEKS